METSNIHSNSHVCCWRVWSCLGWAVDTFMELNSYSKSNQSQESEWDGPEHQAQGPKLKFNSMIVYGGQSETVFIQCSVAMQDSLGIEEQETNNHQR